MGVDLTEIMKPFIVLPVVAMLLLGTALLLDRIRRRRGDASGR